MQTNNNFFDKQNGFTLLEVLIALAIFAISSATLVLSDGQSIRQVQKVRDKLIASTLAEETLNRLYTHKNWPNIGITEHISTLNQRQWLIKKEVMPWNNDLLRKVIIHVFEGNKNTETGKVYQLTGFIGKTSHE